MIDFLRGIAIFLVLWGHSIQYLTCNDTFFSNVMFKIIYSFHMPLFMFLSGYVFYWSCKRKSLNEILLSRFKGIAIPMMVWGGISFVLTFRNGIPNSVVLFFKGYVQECLNIWFLWAVFVASVLIAAIYKCKTDNKVIRYTMMILAMFVVALLPGYTGNLFVYPYFLIGFAFSENKIFSSKKYKIAEPIFLLAWICLLFFYQNKHYVYTSGMSLLNSEYGFRGQLVIDIYRYAIGLLGTLGIIYLARIVYNRIKDKSFTGVIEYAGQHSIDIYLMQRLLLEFFIARVYSKVVRYFGINYLTGNMILFNCLFTVACAELCFNVISWLARQIEKNNILSFVLFGRKI